MIASRGSVGGGTTGLAVFSLLALLLALALVALLSLKPWDSTSREPSLSLAPGLGVALDDAVAVIAEPVGVRVAAARVAPVGRSAFVDSRAHHPAERDPVPAIGVAAARPVQVMAPASPPPQPQPAKPQRPPAVPPSPPVPVAAPAPAPAPVATPVASPQLVTGDDRPFPQSVIDREGDAGYVLKLQAEEGGEYAFALAFQVLETIYGEPGADSMVMALGGDQLVVPVAVGITHEAVVHLKATSDESGFYAAFFDGSPLAAESDVSLIEPEGGEVRAELFFLREGELVDTSEILFDAARIGSTLESVLP